MKKRIQEVANERRKLRSQSTLNIFNGRQNTVNNETRINLEDEGRKTGHTAANGNDLVSQFWNMTDSMPRENQVSFRFPLDCGKSHHETGDH